MSEHQRDFYRIQDRIAMSWRPAADHIGNEADEALIELNQELDEELPGRRHLHHRGRNVSITGL